jgi:hypothetical protein
MTEGSALIFNWYVHQVTIVIKSNLDALSCLENTRRHGLFNNFSCNHHINESPRIMAVEISYKGDCFHGVFHGSDAGALKTSSINTG